MASKSSACCPVCGTWFYPTLGSRQKYDKELCVKTAGRAAANRRRRNPDYPR